MAEMRIRRKSENWDGQSFFQSDIYNLVHCKEAMLQQLRDLRRSQSCETPWFESQQWGILENAQISPCHPSPSASGGHWTSSSPLSSRGGASSALAPSRESRGGAAPRRQSCGARGPTPAVASQGHALRRKSCSTPAASSEEKGSGEGGGEKGKGERKETEKRRKIRALSHRRQWRSGDVSRNLPTRPAYNKSILALRANPAAMQLPYPPQPL